MHHGLQAAVAGRFSIVRELGRGGMGIVFLAQDVLLERPVAIKLLAPDLSARPAMRRRFLREARIAAQCFHPHIVPIHAVEEAGDLAFFVMAYVRGETLADRLQRRGPLAPDVVARIGREVGWALAYAHDRGVVHRDVKPENILLEADTDRALIADFGIALLDDPSRPPSRDDVAGTARFMAPEQALGEPIDGRADLYALGVTLHVAATGRYPFAAHASVALLAAPSLRDAAPVRDRAPALPTALADAIDRCLAARPDDRFATAAAFVQALEPATIAAVPSPLLTRLRDRADGALGLYAWAQVFSVTTRLLIAGEQHGFGGAIINAVGVGVSIAAYLAAVGRATEAVSASRRALRSGSSLQDVADALGGTGSGALRRSPPAREVRVQGAFIAVGGASLAAAQGTLAGLPMPDGITDLVQVALLVAPPLLIGRGLATALRESALSRWATSHLRVPLANRFTRFLARHTAADPHAIADSGTAHTESKLEQDAGALFAALPTPVRATLRELPGAAASLAREAERMRGRDRELAMLEQAERRRDRYVGGNGHALDAHRNGHGEQATQDTALALLLAERATVQRRLTTAVSALESMRLELLRLRSANTAPDLTEAFAIVRDLQHRVDAEQEVRALLSSRRPERTPT